MRCDVGRAYAVPFSFFLQFRKKRHLIKYESVLCIEKTFNYTKRIISAVDYHKFLVAQDLK